MNTIQNADIHRYLRHALESKFIERKERNSHYSLRAFARSLDVDASFLSKLLRGQKKFSSKMIQNLIVELDLSQEDLEAISLQEGNSKNPTYLNEDRFLPISKWYFFAILELFELPDFQPDYNWMAKKLGLNPIEVRSALNTLIEQGHVLRVGDNLKVNSSFTSWLNSKNTDRTRKCFQKQVVDQARNAIEEVPFDERDNLSLTIAANSKLLPTIKEKIRKFNQEMQDLINDHGAPDEVYQMSISYFPLTKKNQTKYTENCNEKN